MGLRADIIQELEKYEITKIEGQPTEEDLMQLTLELSNALGSVATTLGGGEHGHVGLINDETEYVTFSKNGKKFIATTNPGAYPQVPMPTLSSESNKLPSTKQSKTNSSSIKPSKPSRDRPLPVQSNQNG